MCSSDLLAVGVNGPQPLVFSWNGTTWSLSATPGQPDYNYITALSCPTVSYCIATGYDYLGAASGTQPAAWQWSGGSWTELTVGTLATKWNYFNAVKCLSPGYCEAVGSQGRYQTFPHALAEVWNGRTWTVQSAPAQPFASAAAVACASSSRCEAVGSSKTATFAMGWNGSRWSTQKTPAITGSANASSELTGVSCYSTGCTAVGSHYTGSGLSTLAEALTGSAWKLQSPVGSGNISGAVDTSWSAVHCGTAASCTAVGSWDAGAGTLTLAETWNGHAWQQDTTPSPGGSAALAALSCTAGTSVCTAVGIGGVADPPFGERN